MTSVLISGYRSMDIGIFSQKDPKLPIIKEAIRQDLLAYLEEGVDWFIFTGALGFEVWCLEVLEDLLQEGYTCQRAVIFPFETHGQQWNEAHQAILARFKQLDFVKYAYPSYESPQQFRDYNQFLADHTEEAYLFYDPENETNLKYLLHTLLNQKEYTIHYLTFDRLNEIAENFTNSE